MLHTLLEIIHSSSYPNEKRSPFDKETVCTEIYGMQRVRKLITTGIIDALFGVGPSPRSYDVGQDLDCVAGILA
jgi:hypothetical protein